MKRITDQDFDRCELIINPSRFPQYVKLLRRALKHTNFAKIVESRSREHFLYCIREFLDGEKPYLLVWGGDGTAHDTINALVKYASDESLGRKAVGFMRGGSGNGIQDSYEVPLFLKKQLISYAESMRNDWVEGVDLLSTDDGEIVEYGQLLGVGFDVKVLNLRNRRVKQSGKFNGMPKPGLLNYLSSALNTFFKEPLGDREFNIDLIEGRYSFRGFRVNAEFPFTHLRRTTQIPMLEVGTRPYYGSLFKVCPDVVCNDGKLDLYLFNFLDRPTIIKNALLLWKGEHGKINKKLIRRGKPIIERYEISECVISSEYPFLYHIDGELREAPKRETYEVKIGVNQKAIRFLVPGTFYRKFHPDFSQ
ncbi:MAG: diacylglycerol kinase family protein [Spirochaetia bacterium]